MSEKLLGYDELEAVVRESLDRLHRDGPQEEMKSFGIDYDDIADHVIELFGDRSAEWFAGFHSALCLAMRHWNYRMPQTEEG